jgi:NitT/TauT family transport system substrate-binding protein
MSPHAPKPVQPRRARLVVALLALLAGFVLVSGCGSGSSPRTWTDGIIAPKDDAGFEYMALRRGYFKRLGVDVKLVPFVGTVQLTQALLAGAIDSAELDPTPAIKADLHGAQLKIIGSTLPGLTYDLVGRGSVKAVHDLPGKTVATSAPGALPDTFTRAVLATKGLNPRSITVVSAGTDAQRLQALVHGRVDATALSAAVEPRIGHDPALHVLARAHDVVPLYPRLVIVANAQSLRSKPVAAVRFLAGEMQGITYALAHPLAEIALTASVIHKPASDPGIVYLNRLIASSGAAAPYAAVPVAKLRWLVAFESAHGLLAGKPDLTKIIDDSYRRRALKLLPGA